MLSGIRRPAASATPWLAASLDSSLNDMVRQGLGDPGVITLATPGTESWMHPGGHVLLFLGWVL